ncbi:MAG TPA: phosphate ABC transporter substrate-binding protein [Candidatus Baltobacteraceae bacterium]|nr:phosphate ABC transporter substrate-binding protein [Candidatus Baltobacteraceae bacterium]
MKRTILASALALATALPLAALADTQLTAVGSTALLPLVKQSAADYAAKRDDVKIQVSGGGSYVGIAQVSSGAADLGDSDVVAAGNSGLVDHKVAVVAFAIAVNPAAGVTNLSAKQIRDVFAGRVSNWKEVGGKDQQIVVINRPRTSGTRAVFKSTIMGVSKISEAGLTEDSSGAVTTMVSTTPGAVTYVALGYTKDKPVTVVSINGIAPSVQNIQTGKYPIWSYEHIFTKGKAKPEAEDFINFVAHNDDVLWKLGYIPVHTMKVHENSR